MTSTSRSILSHDRRAVDLYSGDHLNREEFHRAYEQTPEDFRAQLIGGVVYVTPPTKIQHGILNSSLGAILARYQAATPGLECGMHSTILLGHDSEPEPDAYLRILPKFGGQSTTTDDDYISGAPELIAEIATSGRSIDLHAKRRDYMRFGVREYIVVCIRERELRWFDLPEDREIVPDADNICRMRCFPGLWIDKGALLNRDDIRLLETAQRGIDSDEHADFVNTLRASSDR